MPTVACEPQRASRGIRIVALVAVVPMAVGMLLVLCILGYIVPRFAEIFAKFKIEPPLPVPTQILCGIGLVVRQFWYLFGLAWLAATAGLISWGIRTPHQGRLVLMAVIGFGSWVFFGLLMGLINILLFQPLVKLIQPMGHG